MRRRSLLAKVVVLVVIWLGIGWVSGQDGLRFLEGPQDELFWRIRWRVGPRPSESPRVAVFPIDLQAVKSLEAQDTPGRPAGFHWPLPHRFYARAIRRLSDLGVKAVGFDILFSDWALSSESADLLAAITSASAAVVVAGQVEQSVGMSLEPSASGQPDDDEEGYDFGQETSFVEKGPASWAGAVFGAGMVNLDKDVNAGGTVRAHPLVFATGKELQPSLALQAYQAWKGIRGAPVIDGTNLRLADGTLIPMERIPPTPGMRTEWVVHPTWQPTAGVERLHLGEYFLAPFDALSTDYLAHSERLQGAIVLVGVGSDLLGDTIAVPGNPQAPGVLLHATLLDSLTRTGFLTRLDQGPWRRLPEIVLLLLGLLGLLAEIRLSTLAGAMANVGLWVGFEALAVLLFCNGWLLRTGPVVVGFPLAMLGIYVTGYFFEGREKALIREMFGKQVSPDVVQTLLENPQEALTARRQEITVCFIDVCGFTSFSEKHTPERVLVQLNYYFSQLMPIIYDNRGRLDKFIGDAMMITTDSLITAGNHALAMVQIAVQIRDKVDLINTNLPAGIHPFQVSMGMNSGEAIMGNMGSADRMEYTVIGDTVNLASRLQGKAGRQEIVIGPRTYELTKDTISVESLEPFLVKGKDTPVQAYRVIGLTTARNDKENHLRG